MHRARCRFAFAAMEMVGQGLAGLGLSGLGIAAALALALPSPAHAQQAVNINRDCQTLRTCNFTRNGQPRGCLSSYTCRTCRMLPVKCNIGGRTVCREMVCSWGG